MYCKIVFLCSRPSEKRGNRQFHVVIIIAKAPIKSTVDSMIGKSPLPPTHTQALPPPPRQAPRAPHEHPSNRAKRGGKKERRERENTDKVKPMLSLARGTGECDGYQDILPPKIHVIMKKNLSIFLN